MSLLDCTGARISGCWSLRSDRRYDLIVCAVVFSQCRRDASIPLTKLAYTHCVRVCVCGCVHHDKSLDRVVERSEEVQDLSEFAGILACIIFTKTVLCSVLLLNKHLKTALVQFHLKFVLISEI